MKKVNGELKSCPFCGGEVSYVPDPSQVWCRNCCFSIEDECKEAAIKRWNTRPPEPVCKSCKGTGKYFDPFSRETFSPCPDCKCTPEPSEEALVECIRAAIEEWSPYVMGKLPFVVFGKPEVEIVIAKAILLKFSLPVKAVDKEKEIEQMANFIALEAGNQKKVNAYCIADLLFKAGWRRQAHGKEAE